MYRWSYRMIKIIKPTRLSVLALLVLSTPLLAQQPGGSTPRRLGPAMDIADAPVPKVAGQRSREAFDRARQSLQRVRSLNSAANSRRQDSQGNDTTKQKPRPRPKPIKSR